MSELGQWLFQKQRDDLLKAIDTRAARTGVTQGISGFRITVTDPLTGGNQTELLTVLGNMPAVGERVLIIPLGDGSRVAMRLGTPAVGSAPRIGVENSGSLLGTVERLDAGSGLIAALNGPDEATLSLDRASLFVPPFGSQAGFHIQGGRALYLTTMTPLGTLAGVTLTANRLYYVPVWIPKTADYNGFVFEVTTAVSGSVQMGLYAMNSSFLVGAREILSTKTAVSTTGVKTFSFTTTSVQGGRWVWLGLCSTVAMALKGSTTAANLPSFRGGTDAAGTTVYLMGSETLTAGWANLPTDGSAGSLSNTYLHLGLVAA